MFLRSNFLILIFGAILFLANFEDCGNGASSKGSKGNKSVKMGNYSAETPDSPGFLKLEVKEDQKVTFLNVVTLHLPPAEIERLNTKFIIADGKVCFEEKPKTVEPCVVSSSEEQITLKLIPGGKEVSLKRIK